MKKLIPLVLSFVFFAGISISSFGSHTSATQIDVIHNDTNWIPCTYPDKYIPEVKFYRDCSGSNASAPTSLTLSVKSTCYGALTFQMDPYSVVTATDTFGGGRLLLKNCVTGADVPCTEEYLYRYYNPDGTFNITLPGPCRDWTFSWSLCCRPSNNQNLNGDAIYVETRINNTFSCDTAFTGPTGIPPNDTCVNNLSYNNSAKFNDDRPVVSFCVGKHYKYFMGATDADGDSLAYKVYNPLSAAGTAVAFTNGYSVNDPIPVVNRPVTLDEKNGILTFTPAQSFIGSFAYLVEEWRDSCFVDSIFVNGDSVATIATKKVKVGTIMRDTRFIFGLNCVTELPNFGNDPKDPNAPYDPNNPPLFTDNIVLNCAVKKFKVRMNITMQCNTLEPLGSDFRLIQGPVENPTAIFGIDSATANNCVNNEFSIFTIHLYEPLGPGQYKLFFKRGDDFNTLQTDCGINIPEYTFIDITVLNNFEFELNFDTVYACRPADPAPVVKANYDYADYYAWKYDGSPIGGDSTQYQVVDSGGNWSVEVNVKGCFDSDNFYVDVTNNRPVEVPNYYLCPSEIDTLLVRLDTVRQGSNHTWYWLNDKTGLFEIVSTNQNFDVSSFSRGGVFYSEVTLNGICTEEDTFEVTANPVIARIGRDTTICYTDKFWLYNHVKEPKNPEDHVYQWFLDDDSIPGATNDSLYITTQGEYKLVVTKRNACSDVDSMNIFIADSLAKPSAACILVTFENGQVKQVFDWDPIPGADSYEVQEIHANRYNSGWIPANGRGGIGHTTFGPQTNILVRAVNAEVDENAICKYSLTEGASACEAFVKPTNVFTPNGDGINDFLTFDLVELFPGSVLKIFNRWGKLIYEDASYYNDWDGGDFEDGTYFYILEINDTSLGTIKGTFTLLR